MSTCRATVASTWSPEDVFAYLARFSNAAKWDPGVLTSEDTEPGSPRCGSTYRLVVWALGRRVPLEYRIEEIDPPRRVVLHAENSAIRSTDVIEVSPAPGGGSTVTYKATIRAKGGAALLTPLVGVALRRIGDRAAAGLRAALAA
jgi:uncharacterized protein YndB with AHSA1/START domain